MAHRLEAFSDDDIKNILGESEKLRNRIRNSKDIINIMERLFKNTYGGAVSNTGFIYSVINEKIMGLL